MREAGGTTIPDAEGPFMAEFIAKSSDFAPSEGRPEIIVGGYRDAAEPGPIRATGAGEGEENPERPFAETSDGDAGRHRAVAEQKNRTITRPTQGRIPFVGRWSDAGSLGGLGFAHVEAGGRAARPRRLFEYLRLFARHAFTPIRQRVCGVPFIGLGVRRHDHGDIPATTLEQGVARHQVAASEQAEDSAEQGHGLD